MKTRTLFIAAVALLTGLATFAITFAARSRTATPEPADASTAALMNWLDVDQQKRQQIQGSDPQFSDDLAKLRAELVAHRAALATALEDASSSDELITSRVESVIAASNAIERRITRYLLTVREQLTPQQQQKLFGLCAEGVRQGPGWRCRFGQAAPGGAGQQGPGPRGAGRGFMGGR